MGGGSSNRLRSFKMDRKVSEVSGRVSHHSAYSGRLYTRRTELELSVRATRRSKSAVCYTADEVTTTSNHPPSHPHPHSPTRECHCIRC